MIRYYRNNPFGIGYSLGYDSGREWMWRILTGKSHGSKFQGTVSCLTIRARSQYVPKIMESMSPARGLSNENPQPTGLKARLYVL